MPVDTFADTGADACRHQCRHQRLRLADTCDDACAYYFIDLELFIEVFLDTRLSHPAREGWQLRYDMFLES